MSKVKYILQDDMGYYLSFQGGRWYTVREREQAYEFTTLSSARRGRMHIPHGKVIEVIPPKKRKTTKK